MRLVEQPGDENEYILKIAATKEEWSTLRDCAYQAGALRKSEYESGALVWRQFLTECITRMTKNEA